MLFRSAQSKWGGKSAYFDGANSRLVSASNSSLNMGSGDFAVECWVYWNGTSVPYQNIIGSNSAGFTGNATFFRVWGTSAGGLASKIGIGNPSHDGNSSVYSVSSLQPNTWTHIAASRSSGVIRLYINGVLERTGSSDTSTYDFGDNGLSIGASPWDGSNGWYSGYVDDVRITKGSNRGYTGSTITVPTAPFPDIGPDPNFSNVSLLLHMDGTGGSTTFTDSSSNGLSVTTYGAQISTAQNKFGSEIGRAHV